jgi:hypothetical protein
MGVVLDMLSHGGNRAVAGMEGWSGIPTLPAEKSIETMKSTVTYGSIERKVHIPR